MRSRGLTTRMNGFGRAARRCVRPSTMSSICSSSISVCRISTVWKCSTGFGNGSAIPHGKIPGLDKVFGYFVRLDSPIDFQAVDGMPVVPGAPSADMAAGLTGLSAVLMALIGREASGRGCGISFAAASPTRATPRTSCRTSSTPSSKRTAC